MKERARARPRRSGHPVCVSARLRKMRSHFVVAYAIVALSSVHIIYIHIHFFAGGIRGRAISVLGVRS